MTQDRKNLIMTDLKHLNTTARIDNSSTLNGSMPLPRRLKIAVVTLLIFNSSLAYSDEETFDVAEIIERRSKTLSSRQPVIYMLLP